MNYIPTAIDGPTQGRLLWASVPAPESLVIPASVTLLHSIPVPAYFHRVSHRPLPAPATLAFREFSVGNLEAAEVRCREWLAESGENAECYVLLASICIKIRKYEAAGRCADKAISLNAALAEPYIFKGLILKEAGRIVEAMSFFRMAAQMRPDNADACIGLANCHLALNDLPAAIRFCGLAVAKQPESVTYRYELGNLLRMSGNLEEARKYYEAVLERKPDYGPAWLQLGHLHSAAGSTWLALHHFERAVHVDPYLMDAHLAYGNALKELRLAERAMQVFLKAITLFSTSALLYGSLAGTYHELGLIELTVETYRHALQLMPNYPDAHCNLANALKEQGLVSEAERHYTAAIALCSTHADSFNNLANIRREQGQILESVTLYRKALAASSGFAAAHSNLATVLQQTGRLTEAVFHYQRAVAANPGSPDTHLFLGNALKEAGNPKGAVECYARAIHLNPASPEAHAFLGTVYKDSGNIIEAIAAFRLALKFRPNFVEVYCNLVHSLQLICDWTDYAIRIERLVGLVSEQLEKGRPPTVHPHHTMLYPLSPVQRRLIASRHASFCTERINFLCLSPRAISLSTSLLSSPRIRVGYVSSDFCNHPTSHLLQSVPGLHDRSRFEVFCFSLIAPDGSSFRKKLESEVEHFIDVSAITNVVEIADLIAKHGVHILLNLNGYTKGARNEIFALRPAPIQAMYVGYPGTSGAAYMDYIITDSVTSPLEHEEHYSEKLAYMPNSFFIGDHANMFPHLLKDVTVDGSIKIIVPPPSSVLSASPNTNSCELKGVSDEVTLNEYIQFHLRKRVKECQGCKPCGEGIPDSASWKLDRATYGLPNNVFVFCNFNQLYKLDPTTFSCWCRILSRVPNSVLWLLRFPKAGESNLRDTAQRHGIDPNRFVFTEVAGKEEHVRRGQLADVCLDTPLCNGHTTGMDVLWAGCPIVTMPLNSFASRVGSSIVSAIGCPELITHSYQEYEKLSVRLAIDKQYFNDIKKKIWYNRLSSPLFNVPQYVKDFDNLLFKMWHLLKKNQKPVHILDSKVAIS